MSPIYLKTAVKFYKVVKLIFPLAGNGSADEVCAKADVGGVGETERGGGHSVHWVGCGKSTKVVVLEELGLCFPLAVNNRVVGKGQTSHLQSSSIGGGGDNATSGVSSENLANCVWLGITMNGNSQRNNNKSSHGDRPR